MQDNNSTLVSRNITIMERRTSVRLEPEMWKALFEISNREGCSIHDICALIAIRKNDRTSLTAAIRVFIMLYFRAGCTEEGHQKAGHGCFSVMMKRARVPEEFLTFFHGNKRKGYAPRLDHFARRVSDSWSQDRAEARA